MSHLKCLQQLKNLSRASPTLKSYRCINGALRDESVRLSTWWQWKSSCSDPPQYINSNFLFSSGLFAFHYIFPFQRESGLDCCLIKLLCEKFQSRVLDRASPLWQFQTKIFQKRLILRAASFASFFFFFLTRAVMSCLKSPQLSHNLGWLGNVPIKSSLFVDENKTLFIFTDFISCQQIPLNMSRWAFKEDLCGLHSEVHLFNYYLNARSNCYFPFRLLGSFWPSGSFRVQTHRADLWAIKKKKKNQEKKKVVIHRLLLSILSGGAPSPRIPHPRPPPSPRPLGPTREQKVIFDQGVEA